MHSSTLPALVLGLLSTIPLTAQDGTARYELRFDSTWSAGTHPTDFPPGPHFSPLVGATHDSGVSFWEPGGIATFGIERMAEVGSTFWLSGEVDTAIAAGTADQFLVGPGINSPASGFLRFTADAEHSLLTLVTMLAPSPDWFVGVNGLELRPNGVWVDDLTIELSVWDAGTDAGVSYLSGDIDLTPHLPIAPVTQGSGPFQGASLIVGTYHLRRLHSTTVFGEGNPAGSLSVDGEARLGEQLQVTVDDPSGTMPTPSFSVLLLSADAAPNFPDGLPIFGLGLEASEPGELLLGTIFRSFVGADWVGSGVSIPIAIPADSSLVGESFYLQGALAHPSRIGITRGLELFLGS